MPLTTRKRAYDDCEISKASSSRSKSSAPSTRDQTNEFLIGHPARTISGSKLPTLRQVMQVLLHKKNPSSYKKLQDNFGDVVDRIITFWQMAGIKTITKQNCVIRLDKVHREWKLLRKSRNKSYSTFENSCEAFSNKLDKLWDIGAPDAIEIIIINRLLSTADKNQDIAFYLDQRNKREAIMSGDDKILKQKVLLQEGRQQASTSDQVEFCQG